MVAALEGVKANSSDVQDSGGQRNARDKLTTRELAVVGRLTELTRSTTKTTQSTASVITADGATAVNSTSVSSTLGDVGGQTSSVVGIAVGVTVIAVILVLLCLAVVVLLIRRRRRRRRNKNIVRVENPQYKPGENVEEVTLGIGPTGAVKYSSGKQNGSRKRKEAAPPPPIYRPNAAPDKSWDSLTKRKAPPPPRNLNVELYEKDSPRSSTENIRSVENPAAAGASPVDDSKDLQTDASPRQPLISGGDADAAEKQGRSPRKNATSPAATGRVSAAADAAAETGDDNNDDVPTTPDVRASLIGKTKSASRTSLDSYDRTLNPFFAN